MSISYNKKDELKQITSPRFYMIKGIKVIIQELENNYRVIIPSNGLMALSMPKKERVVIKQDLLNGLEKIISQQEISEL